MMSMPDLKYVAVSDEKGARIPANLEGALETISWQREEPKNDNKSGK